MHLHGDLAVLMLLQEMHVANYETPFPSLHSAKLYDLYVAVYLLRPRIEVKC